MSSTTTTVKTQQKLNAALADKTVTQIHIKSEAGVWLTVGDSDSSTVVARDSSTVEAWDSSTVEAWDSSTVEARGSSTVEARGSSTVVAWDSSRVVAWDSSTVEARGSSTVEAWDSSTVEAWDSSTVEAWGSSRVVAAASSNVHAWSGQVTAGPHVAVHLHNSQARVDGGVLIDLTSLDLCDADTWRQHHGVTADSAGRVTLFKALGDDLTTGQEYNALFVWQPGADLVCADWRDDHECGGGLHLSPTPAQAADYHDNATRFMRITADLVDVRPIPGGTAKCKVRACRVVAEVDRFGRDLATAGTAAAS